MPASNLKSSLQDILPQKTDGEPLVTGEARRHREVNVTLTDRQKPRISLSSRIKLKDRISWPSDSGRNVLLEPLSPQPYDITYACLMIPRFSSHYLRGDMAEFLRQWLQQICLSFAWRLEHVWVRPEYLQWILTVQPATPPSQCFRVIRQQTSIRIFEDFPEIRRENLSKDFWAPGYLVLVGTTPHPPEMINQYIQLTRQRQGLPPRPTE